MAVVAKTKKQIRDDVILRLTQGKPSSDFEVPNSQIDRWIDIARDRFLADWLLQNGKYDGFYVDAEYIRTEKALALTAVATTDEAEFTCAVAQPILSTPLNDYGVVRVRTKIVASPYTHTTCQKVDRRGLADIKTMEFSAPDPTHPVYYREGQNLYFSGLHADSATASGVAAKAANVTVEYVESMVGSDKDYSISGAHVEQVTEMAEVIGKKQLGIMIVDPVNDGDQNPPQQPVQQTRQRR
jgi:hypothetical protein